MSAKHDPLCKVIESCWCDLIARVRADERARWSPPQPVVEGHVPGLCWCPSCHTAHTGDQVVLTQRDAEDVRRLLEFIFAKNVYRGPDRTDFPGSVHGRTFPEWLALLGGTT